jgi:hypothetical protein
VTVEFGPVVRLAPGFAGSSPLLAATDEGLVAAWTSPGTPSRVMLRAVRLP